MEGRNVRAIDNPPNHVSGWESRFFFARLSSERDIWGVLKQWEEPIPELIPRLYVRLSAPQRWALMYFRGTALCWHPSREEFFHLCESVRFAVMEKGKKHAPKRPCPSEEGRALVDSDSSAEDASELSPTRGSPIVVDHTNHRGASLARESIVQSGSEGMVLSSVVAQLREEFEWHVSNRCSEGTTSDLRLWRSTFKASHTVARRSSSEPTIPKSLITLLNIQKITLRFLLLVEVVGRFSHIVILSVSQQGQLFSSNRARAVPSVVSKEMRCQRYKRVGVAFVGEFPTLDRGSPMAAGPTRS
ncbi:hypothetical protein ACLOJK_023103 [Asimina triloba]